MSDKKKIREDGQVWTPDWVADVMARYAMQDGPRTVLDPASGAGALLRAAHVRATEDTVIRGRDIDPDTISLAYRSGTDRSITIDVADFITDPPRDRYDAILVNPPYVRHHRIPRERKKVLSDLAYDAIGRRIDARAGLHVYFLIQSLLTLEVGGRLSFIVSADICEGVFATVLWEWICSRYRIDAVISFTDRALIGTRDPWYRMETREVPPILFAYLGRGNSRFVSNRSGAVPLTCFLCVYPKPGYQDRLWEVLSHPDTVANLICVGKSYGGGAVKVEPRALERLPLPDRVIKLAGL